MVTNSSGKPPASRTPTLARLASRSSGMLHGVTSFHDDATPTCALPQSASVMPTARSIARAGARADAVGDLVTPRAVVLGHVARVASRSLCEDEPMNAPAEMRDAADRLRRRARRAPRARLRRSRRARDRRARARAAVRRRSCAPSIPTMPELAVAGLVHDIADIADPDDHTDHDRRGAALVEPLLGAAGRAPRRRARDRQALPRDDRSRVPQPAQPRAASRRSRCRATRSTTPTSPRSPTDPDLDAILDAAPRRRARQGSRRRSVPGLDDVARAARESLAAVSRTAHSTSSSSAAATTASSPPGCSPSAARASPCSSAARRSAARRSPSSRGAPTTR